MNRKKEYVLLFVLSIIFFAAGRYVFRIWEVYHEAEDGYQKLKQYIVEGADKDEVDEGKDQIADSKETEEIVQKIDFEGLRAINEDIVAWIQIPGIGVDYPVVQGEDNEHYLHYTFDGKENIAGSIFLDFRNKADFTDRKVILYGHNMQDGSMFSQLEKYQDDDFREEQGRVILYLPDKTLEYEIVKCRKVSMWDLVYGNVDEEKESVPKQMILSTCSSSPNLRFILKCIVTESLMFDKK